MSNRADLPCGSRKGQTNVSDLLLSGDTTSAGLPPPPLTRHSEPRQVKTITSPSPHANASAESATVTAGPPESGTFTRWLFCTKPIHLPSGENLVCLAVSVPGIGVTRRSFRFLRYNCSVASPPGYTIDEPSGEMAKFCPHSSGRMRAESGTTIVKRVLFTGGVIDRDAVEIQPARARVASRDAASTGADTRRRAVRAASALAANVALV